VAGEAEPRGLGALAVGHAAREDIQLHRREASLGAALVHVVEHVELDREGALVVLERGEPRLCVVQRGVAGEPLRLGFSRRLGRRFGEGGERGEGCAGEEREEADRLPDGERRRTSHAEAPMRDRIILDSTTMARGFPLAVSS
jgi:hypothetical protein